MQWDRQTCVSREEAEQDGKTASQGASRDTDRRRGRKGGENGDMTEGLITSLFKQGTSPEQTELQSRERENVTKYTKLRPALISINLQQLPQVKSILGFLITESYGRARR